MKITLERDTLKKVKLLLKYSEKIKENLPGTAAFYAEKALVLLEYKPDSELLAQAYYELGEANYFLNKFDDALSFYEKSLKIFTKLHKYRDIGSCYNAFGNIYYYKNDMYKALLNYQRSIYYLRKDTTVPLPKIANGWHNIAMIHDDLGNTELAFRYYYKALQVFKKYNSLYYLGNCYNSLGTLHSKLNNLDSSIYYFQNSLRIFKQTNNLIDLNMAYTNLAYTFMAKGDFSKALNYYIIAENIAKKAGDKIGLAEIYTDMGILFYKLGNYHKSIASLKKGMRYVDSGGVYVYVKDIYSYLRKNYIRLKKYKLAIAYGNSLIAAIDSLNKIENAKSVSNAEAKYQAKEKELKIKSLKKENILTSKLAEKQKKILFIVITGLAILGVFLILIFLLLRKQKQINTILLQKNKEIENQKQLLELQKEKLQKKNLEIVQSINYANSIQKSILPSISTIEDYVSGVFVFFVPKDVVSGDFYWWTHIENNIVVSVSDCTGHGVPGAFMSMLGISFLHEIVEKEYITHPGIVLKRLRKEIVNTLKQKGEIGEQKDGMDMALVSINHENGTLQFAGANNPVYIVTHRSFTDLEITASNEGLESRIITMSEGEYILVEIRPDKMPIAIYEKMNKFETFTLKVDEGDLIYLFSDGFQDQFGGKNSKRFMQKRFKKLLLQIADKPLYEQKEIISTTFEEWKGSNEQVDDVTIVGVKI